MTRRTLELFLLFVLTLNCRSPREINTSDETNQSQTTTKVSQDSSYNTSVVFIAQEGKEIKADVLSKNEKGMAISVALFTPPVEPTDGNLYVIAVEMLKAFYGKGRGSIQLKDARIEQYPNGKFSCWQISNPKQKYCLAQIRVSGTDERFGGAMFFVK